MAIENTGVMTITWDCAANVMNEMLDNDTFDGWLKLNGDRAVVLVDDIEALTSVLENFCPNMIGNCRHIAYYGEIEITPDVTFQTVIDAIHTREKNAAVRILGQPFDWSKAPELFGGIQIRIERTLF